MSTRLLRKLEKKHLQESQLQEAAKLGHSSSSEEEEVVEPRKAFNAFALLDGDEDESSDSTSDSNDEKTEKVKEVKNYVAPVKLSKNAKTKKNKKKKIEVQQALNSDEELDLILQQAKEKDEEIKGGYDSDPSTYDFEEEYDVCDSPALNYDSNFNYFTTKRFRESLSLLRINVKDLDPDTEFRNLFGKMSFKELEEVNSSGSSNDQKKSARRWGGKDRRSVPGAKKLVLTKIRDEWYPTNKKSVIMEELNDDDVLKNLEYKEEDLDYEELEMKISKEKKIGVKYFKFAKINNGEERVNNSRFYASVVITPDHESLVNLLQQSPYHVETILQVATIFVRQGEKSRSNGLIEKALFVFDRAFKPSFDIGDGLMRLPFENYMNRQFCLTLFRYIMLLSERATFFTALTYCKFLLSLNPAEDPYGIRYFIDFYAIMAGEFEYLIKFVNSPLVTTYDKWLTPGLVYSVVLAYLFTDKRDLAKQWLLKAYLKYPYCGVKLLEAIGKPYQLPNLSLPENDEIRLSTESYLIRASKMWDESSRKFLHDELLDIINNHSTPTKKLIDEIPRNLLRFSILSGESKIMAKIPRYVWENNDIFDFDILPPQADDHDIGFGGSNNKIVDKLNDYIDENVIASIVRNRSENEDVFEMVRRMTMMENGE